MSKIDLYNLQASTPSTSVGGQELNKDLELTTSVAGQSGIVQGTVTSGSSPVENATVKIFSSDGTPLYHANTNSQGKYVIPDVVKGTLAYVITATKEGYLTPVAIPLTVSTSQPTTVNISLTADTEATKNIIYGKILTPPPENAPIQQATVNVYQVVDGKRTLIAATTTNTDGQYLFPYLINGDYVVEAFKANYLTNESALVNLSGSEKSKLNLALTPLATTKLGTVSGFINNAVTKAPIANAIVALYQIIGPNDEILIQQTKTNLNGRYLFGNVPDGTFIVKSFAQIDSLPTD